MLKEDYQKQVEKLTAMVDGGVDTCDFLQVSGTYCIISGYQLSLFHAECTHNSSVAVREEVFVCSRLVCVCVCLFAIIVCMFVQS